MYGTLLLLYPPRIRFEFGDEMLNVFGEQVRYGCRQRGLVGLWCVWRSVAVEIVQLSIPLRVDVDRLRVPAASILTSAALFLLFTWLTNIAVPCHK